jgi:hypothetical protein
MLEFTGDFHAAKELKNSPHLFNEQGDCLLERITGEVHTQGFTGSFPNLQFIESGSLYAEGYTGEFPCLREICWDAYLFRCKSAFPNLVMIGCDAYLENYTGEFPCLETIGGDIYIDGYEGAMTMLHELDGCVLGSRTKIRLDKPFSRVGAKRLQEWYDIVEFTCGVVKRDKGDGAYFFGECDGCGLDIWDLLDAVRSSEGYNAGTEVFLQEFINQHR